MPSSSTSAEIVTVDAAEALALTDDQVGCQVVHHFGPGVYIRECTIPAGVFAIGHHQRLSHINIMLTGSLALRCEDGEIRVMKAPQMYLGRPGRKMGLVLETVVWLNVYATDERDVEKLEEMFLDKSPVFLAHAERLWMERVAAREGDRQDFIAAVAELGFSPEDVRKMSENEADQMSMPPDAGANLVVRRSAIEGLGAFTQVAAVPGDILAPARLGGRRTPAGRFTNHSGTPNAYFVERGGGAFLVALTHIAPFCNELTPGDEVTVDYRQALQVARRLAV